MNCKIFILIFIFKLVSSATRKNKQMSTSFCIDKTWDDRLIDHKPACIQLKRADDGLLLTIEAPYFNRPAKPDRGVDEVFNLYDYEGNILN